MITKVSILGAVRKDGIEHAGYLAFLSILSFFPFLIFLVSIITNFGISKVFLIWTHLVLENLPSNIAESLEPRIAEIITGPPHSLMTVAILGMVWTASSMVEGLRTILNRSYRVASTPPYIWRRLLSIAQFFIIVCVVICSSLLLIIVPAILKKIESSLGINFEINYDFLHIRKFMIFMILLISISFSYYLIPNINQRWDNTLPGALFCIMLWAIVLKLFFLYLQKFDQFNLMYGSLAGIIGSLIFFYLISFGFIVGAEFNYNFKRAYRSKFKFIRY